MNIRERYSFSPPKKFGDDYGKIVKGRLIPGASIGLHTHEVNYEVMYFIEGEATVIYNEERMTFSPGQVHYCAKGQSHTIINEGSEDVVFFAVLPNARMPATP